MPKLESEKIEKRLKEILIGRGEGDARIVDLEVRAVQDLEDLPAWRATLFLTPPQKESWSVEATRDLKRLARTELDSLAFEAGSVLDGVTSVTVTTRNAPTEQIADEDVPVEGEISKDEINGDA